MNPSLKFFNPFGEIRKSRSGLPHWEQPGVCLFLTFRLADSIPEQKLRNWREEREIWTDRHPKPWTDAQEREYHLRFSGQIDRWLDAGEGSCVLKSAGTRSCLTKTLLAGNGDAFALHSFVIMPNHVHLLTSFRQGELLKNRLQRWKGGSARCINEELQRTGRLWQLGYFDRLIRDAEHFGNCVRYIRRNPQKACLREGQYALWEAGWLKEMVL